MEKQKHCYLKKHDNKWKYFVAFQKTFGVLLNVYKGVKKVINQFLIAEDYWKLLFVVMSVEAG